MGFLDKVDVEEKACNTVQNAFKMHEPTKKMVVDRFWPYHDKVRESSIAKTIELDSCYKYDNIMSAYAYARDYGMEVTLKFDGMSPYMLMVNTEIKNGFFGLSAKTTEDDGLTRISPEFLDTVLENAFKNLSHEELRRARVEANKQSLPEYFTFSKEIVENCELAPVKEAKNTHGAGFTIVPNNGKFEDSVNICLYEKSYGTEYRLADITAKAGDQDLVSVTLYPDIADFSPEFLKTVLEETIRSTDEKLLTENLHKANQESITDLRYAPKLLENASTISPDHAKRIDKYLFTSGTDIAREFGDKRTLAVCHGRLSIVQLKNLDNTDVLKDSQGNLIVYDTVEDAVQAAAVMTSYTNMNRDVQDKLAHMSHSFGAAQDVNNVTELADMISQGLSENKDFIDGLDDLKETELTR